MDNVLDQPFLKKGSQIADNFVSFSLIFMISIKINNRAKLFQNTSMGVTVTIIIRIVNRKLYCLLTLEVILRVFGQS